MKIIVKCPWCGCEYGSLRPTVELSHKCSCCGKPIVWAIAKDLDKPALIQELATLRTRIRDMEDTLTKSYDMSRDCIDREMMYYHTREDKKDREIERLKREIMRMQMNVQEP